MAVFNRMRSGFEIIGWLQSIVWIVGIFATTGIVTALINDFSKLSFDRILVLALFTLLLLTSIFIARLISKGDSAARRLRPVANMGSCFYGSVETDLAPIHSFFTAWLSVHNPTPKDVRIVNVRMVRMKGIKSLKNIPVRYFGGYDEGDQRVRSEIRADSTIAGRLEFFGDWAPGNRDSPVKARMEIGDQSGGRVRFNMKFERQKQWIDGKWSLI